MTDKIEDLIIFSENICFDGTTISNLLVDIEKFFKEIHNETNRVRKERVILNFFTLMEKKKSVWKWSKDMSDIIKNKFYEVSNFFPFDKINEMYFSIFEEPMIDGREQWDTYNDFMLLKDLFNRLSNPEKINVLNKFSRKTSLGNHICTKCLRVVSKKIKCIHYACSGLCERCHKEGVPNNFCNACNLKNETNCPICKELLPEKWFDIFKCRHAVCWKCIAQATRAFKPIIICPTCRKDL